MKKALLISMIVLFVLIIPSLLTAQTPPPADPNDVLVPLDGGLSLLVAAAVGYVSKKMFDARKK
jgi:hypothetical protein